MYKLSTSLIGRLKKKGLYEPVNEYMYVIFSKLHLKSILFEVRF